MYVVTGGAGFIGSVLVAALNAQSSEDVVVSDWLTVPESWRNLSKRMLADIVPPQQLLEFLDKNPVKPKAILHLGAISDTTVTDGDLVMERNFRSTLHLWNWCTENAVPFIYASSAATYGDGAEGFDDANDIGALSRLRPLNLYGWSKQVFDLRAVRLAERGLAPPQWVGLKFFNVFGPNEYHKAHMQSVVAKTYPDVAAGQPLRLFKSHRPDHADGGQLRDFVWVEDVVAVMTWLLENPAVSGIYNLGTGKARSFADLAHAMFKALGREPRIEYIDMPEHLKAKYQYYTQANMDRLRAAGYKGQFTPLETAVERYIRGFLATEDRFV
ncbi:MAG: ADP-glyceromanno-heptose 6-epimerase [Rhizomicrobium sp.]